MRRCSGGNINTTYRIEGLHCGNCAASVRNALEAKGITAKVTVDPPEVRIIGGNVLRHDDIAMTVAAAGDYKLGVALPVAAGAGGLWSKIIRAFTAT